MKAKFEMIECLQVKHNGEQFFIVFNYFVCKYLNASQYANTIFSFIYSYVSNSALFLHGTLALSLYIDVVLRCGVYSVPARSTYGTFGKFAY